MSQQQIDLFRLQCQEFNNISDSKLELKFSVAATFLAELTIESLKYDLALVYFTGHLLWLDKYPAQGGASRGPILREKDDKIEKQYALIEGSDDWLGQNFYGQSFSQLTGIFSLKRNRPSIITRFGLDPSFL